MTEDYDQIPTEDAIEDWISESGIRCTIRAGFYALCGYVKLPDSLVGVWADEDAAHEALALNVSLTYWSPHWMGFDTGHFGDVWAPDDLIGRVSDEGFQMARTMADMLSDWRGERVPSLDNGQTPRQGHGNRRSTGHSGEQQ